MARRTGETKTEAVINALKERLARVKRLRPRRRLSDDLAEIAQRFDALPVLDAREADEILGYDQKGLSR